MMPRVLLIQDDIDRDPAMVGVPIEERGVFNAQGKAYGVGIYDIDAALPDARNLDELLDRLRSGDPLDRLYAASEASAQHNARLQASARGWLVVDAAALEDLFPRLET